MNGVHDMGGMDGFGPVEVEPDEPVFHEVWEGRVLAMNRAIGGTGAWNIDEGRFGIERLPPHVYLAASYYQKWFLRLERMMVEPGLGDDPQWLYTVVFDGRDLWGADAEPGVSISVEAFEPYLEPV